MTLIFTLRLLWSWPIHAYKNEGDGSDSLKVRVETNALETFVHPYPFVNTKNCSLSIALTATDQKPQKSLKRWYYITRHHIAWMSTWCWGAEALYARTQRRTGQKQCRRPFRGLLEALYAKSSKQSYSQQYEKSLSLMSSQFRLINDNGVHSPSRKVGSQHMNWTDLWTPMAAFTAHQLTEHQPA